MGTTPAGVETLRDCAPWWPGAVVAVQGSQSGEVTLADQWLGSGKFLSKRILVAGLGKRVTQVGASL